MNYYSLNDPTHVVSFTQAVINGLAPGNGLYFPEQVPSFEIGFFRKLPELSLPEIAFHVLKPYTTPDLTEVVLHEITQQVFDFDIPLVEVQPVIYSLELFHGPTLAFKDIGARFLARTLSHIAKDRKIRVLVATSGDTGSAVANGFLGIEGTEVIVLYPKDKVSELQQKQFATLGQNIRPVAIRGTFDDCQQLVKTAFSDTGINQTMNLTSANSINIARWIPQSVYYYWAIAQLAKTGKKIVVAVPSGNVGNISSGVLAQKTGLPIHRFIAASNQNDVLPKYLKSGNYLPKPSVQTIANAMDVGHPNNFPRLLQLHQNNYSEMTGNLTGYSYTNEQIQKLIQSCYLANNYLLDPHGATGFGSLLDDQLAANETGVFLETAHPAKFREVVEPVIGQQITLPAALARFDKRTLVTEELPTGYQEFKQYLMDGIS